MLLQSVQQSDHATLTAPVWLTCVRPVDVFWELALIPVCISFSCKREKERWSLYNIYMAYNECICYTGCCLCVNPAHCCWSSIFSSQFGLSVIVCLEKNLLKGLPLQTMFPFLTVLFNYRPTTSHELVPWGHKVFYSETNVFLNTWADRFISGLDFNGFYGLTVCVLELLWLRLISRRLRWTAAKKSPDSLWPIQQLKTATGSTETQHRAAEEPSDDFTWPCLSSWVFICFLWTSFMFQTSAA